MGGFDNDDYIDVEGEFVPGRHTAKAIYFQGDYWDKPEYIPRSQCVIDGSDEGRGVLRIKSWLCEKNGWE